VRLRVGTDTFWCEGRLPDVLLMMETLSGRALRKTRGVDRRNHHPNGREERLPGGRRTVTGSPTQPIHRDRECFTLALAALLLTLGALPARAQDELVGDRPRLTESSRVVTVHRAQFEGGLRFGVDGDAKTLSAPEFLLRLGLLSRVEFRLGLPDFRRTTMPGGSTRRLGESYLGLKAQLLPSEERLGVALIPGLTKPADEKDHGDVAPELVVAWSGAVSPRWSLGGSLGRSWLKGARRGENISSSTLFLTRALGVGGGTFVEWAADIPDHGAAAQVLYHGYLLGVFPDGQLDVGVGAGLTRAAPDFVIGAGFVIRH